ncbi:MAG: hypothetical protein IJL89_01265 [Firmicutes bacterium]|nr:hypothetical protein [Bacillota bacterium]
MKNKKAAGGIIAALAVAAAGIACVVYNVKKPAEQPQPAGGVQETAAVTEVEEEPATEGTTVEIEELLIGLSDKPLTDEVKAQLEEVNAKLLNYISSNEKENSFITEYGFLFNDTKNNTVTLRDLKDAGVVDVSDDVADLTDILYVRASDIAPYAPNIDANDERLQLFTAFNNENGYFVSNDFYSEGALLQKSDYEQLMLSYSFIHGEVRNPKRGDADYEAIMKATGFEGEYDVKHIACDDSYAVAVVGSLEDTKVLKEYVLAKEDGKWKKAVDNLENSTNPRQEINMLYPKMELGLLPKYTIAKYGVLQNNFTDYDAALVKLGLVDEKDVPASYDCGTSGFAYMEYGDTKLVGCVNEQNKLEFYPVNSAEEAIAYMCQYNDDPPVFIIRFNN